MGQRDPQRLSRFFQKRTVLKIAHAPDHLKALALMFLTLRNPHMGYQTSMSGGHLGLANNARSVSTLQQGIWMRQRDGATVPTGSIPEERRTSGTIMLLKHRNSRGPYLKYPERFFVPDDKVSWDVEWQEYHPTAFTTESVIANDRDIVPEESKPRKGWADPRDPFATQGFLDELKMRESYEGDLQFFPDGLPRNPCGRTGLKDRGALGKWGPNHAADPIVTRYDPSRPEKLQMVAILRKVEKLWAIPGGMVDPGETVSETLKREFKEEAGTSSETPQEQKRNEELIDRLFSNRNRKIAYRGYVDDPRNTDNAWMETVAVHFHCDEETAILLKLEAGDDAAEVQWLDIDHDNPKYQNLFASHRVWVDAVAQNMASIT